GMKGMGGMQSGKMMCDMLELSTEQQKQMKTLRLKMEKAMLPLKADMMKAKGELRLLKAEDKPVLKSINNKIDEVTNLKAKIMKLKAKHHLEVRSILTEEQRLKWEQHQFHKKGRKGHKGHGRQGCGNRCG
ncbi:MAG: periplasmic heavy metal sensor, partial [Calditrichia bacterium]|nr:periplasmic heavy metal sensor [Calditrichia bacterium]